MLARTPLLGVQRKTIPASIETYPMSDTLYLHLSFKAYLGSSSLRVIKAAIIAICQGLMLMLLAVLRNIEVFHPLVLTL